MTVTTLIWTAAGRPEVEGAKGKLLRDDHGTCVVSGDQSERRAVADKALGANFTDRSLFHGVGDKVGQAALWVCSGKGTRSLRMWSLIVAPGHDLPPSNEKAFLQKPGLWLGNRSDPGPVHDILSSPPPTPWAVAIAISGQKHVAPYATVNDSAERWTVRVENTNVSSTPTAYAALRRHALSLRRLGVSADNVLAGTPGLLKTHAEIDVWRRHAPHIAPYAGSPLLELALWTITKRTMEANNE